MDREREIEIEPKHVVVLGGGISGLSAAFYVQKFFLEKRLPVKITLVEQSPVLGGKINTIQQEGFIMETGPDSFLGRKPSIIELTRKLNLEEQLVGTNPQAKKTFILHKDQLHPIPPGLILGIPTEIAPFMKTKLLTYQGKARAALDLILPRRKGTSDESLGGFLDRRLGREIVERIAEPLLAGIYAGETHGLSLQATFPQFQLAEQKHRSLILGMLANKKINVETNLQLPPTARNSLFLSYRNGLNTLVDALIDALDEENVSLKTSLTVEGLDHKSGKMEVKLSNDVVLLADGVIVALPTYAAAKLLPQISEIGHLKDIPYISVANVLLTFDKQEIGHPLNGSGFVVPRTEGKFITACTWTSSKWSHTAPTGKVLLRCYIGRSGDEQWIQLSDRELINRVLADLKQIMGITAEPMFKMVNRWHRSMPQYPVGHLNNLIKVRSELSQRMPNVQLTGSGYEGVGLPDCIRQAKDAARLLLSGLQLP